MGGYANQRLRGGFSLIEVLVSVVVMSFGLLALASLQGALMKAGSESRAQSVALSMASEKLEYFTGYRDREEFQALTDGSDAPVTVDGISYTRSWTVERYAYPDAGGTFAAVADPGETAANHVNNNEFKRLEVQVQWTDASGVSQASRRTAVSPSAPAWRTVGRPVMRSSRFRASRGPCEAPARLVALTRDGKRVSQAAPISGSRRSRGRRDRRARAAGAPAAGARRCRPAGQRRRAGGDLQPDAADRLRGERGRQPVRHPRRG